MKRLLSMLLALTLLCTSMFVLASCGGFEPAASYEDPDVYTTVHDGGTITTAGGTGATAGNVSTVAYAGNTAKDYRDNKSYTYNDYIGGTTGLNWNPHSWETNDDSYILSYQSMGFYDFVLNADLTGYSVVCEMAAALPVDVTADYVGSFGVKEGDVAKAWKISLNQAAKWNDGTVINADTYIYSMQQQLDGLALNRRADSYYAGDFEIVNAKAYLYSGKTVTVDNGLSGEFDSIDDLVKGNDGTYTYKGGKVDIAVSVALDWLGGYSLKDYVESYGEAMFDVEAFNALAALDTDEDGYVAATDDSIGYLQSIITASADWKETAEDWVNYVYVDITYAECTWDKVGVLKTGEYEIVIILAAEMEQPEFYMPYNLSSNWIVKEDVYEANKKYFDKDNKEITGADKSGAVSVTNTYCKSLDANVSYGPYILSNFQADGGFEFVRNENWYGYSDGKHYGQFQTDKISVRVIKEHATALESFLAGNLSGVSLDSEDMEIYASSDRIRYTPESYTTKITFNTNYEKLVALGNNQQILAVSEFRQAFSLAIDREAFTNENTASHEPGYGLLNYMYCYDPFSGALYRESDAAKKALVDLYGLTYGEGGDYANLDAAYEAMTGYDLAAAKVLMQEAYDKAVEAKIYDGKSNIVIDFRVYENDEVYVKMFNYFDTQLKAACVGTDLEGKVSLTMTVDADYYETMYSGNAAIIFSTWGGAAMSPFTMINQVYTDASDGSGNQMEVGYRTENMQVKFKVNGEDVQASLKDWADWCGGVEVSAIDEKLGKFASYSYETRCEFFAAVERIYLAGFATAPIYYRNSASLSSKQIETPTTQYLQIVGTGGIRYITYNYDDATWATTKASVTYN